VANCPRRRRLIILAFRESLIRWASAKRLALPPEMFDKNAVFVQEIFDDRLLAPVHPAGDGNEED